MHCGAHAGNNAAGKDIDFLSDEINSDEGVPVDGFGSTAIQSAFEAHPDYLCYSSLGQGQGDRAQFLQHLIAHTSSPELLGFVYHVPGHWLCYRRHNSSWAKVDSVPAAPSSDADGIEARSSAQLALDLLHMYDSQPEGLHCELINPFSFQSASWC